jgi:DNA-binding MarR family transcriptional regulator
MTAGTIHIMARRNPLQLDRFLPYRLSVLTNVVSGAIAASYARRFGLSIPEWRVLAVLGENPELSAAEVAQRTAMDKVAVSRAVASLLRARRLSRTVSAADRRRSALRLTASGRQVYAEVVPIALNYERQLLQPLDAADQAALDRILAALLCRAEALGPAQDAPPG